MTNIPFKVGDLVQFYPGRGFAYGGHTAHAKVTKVNRRTIEATEVETSYQPGQQWVLHENWLMKNFVSRGMSTPEYNTVFFAAGFYWPPVD